MLFERQSTVNLMPKSVTVFSDVIQREKEFIFC